jgi:hypothetical protein
MAVDILFFVVNMGIRAETGANTGKVACGAVIKKIDNGSREGDRHEVAFLSVMRGGVPRGYCDASKLALSWKNHKNRQKSKGLTCE